MIEQIRELEQSQKSIEKVLAMCRKELVANPEHYGVRIITWDDECEHESSYRRWTCAVKIDAPPCPHTRISGDVTTDRTKYGDDVEYSAVSNFMEEYAVLMW